MVINDSEKEALVLYNLRTGLWRTIWDGMGIWSWEPNIKWIEVEILDINKHSITWTFGLLELYPK